MAGKPEDKTDFEKLVNERNKRRRKGDRWRISRLTLGRMIDRIPYIWLFAIATANMAVIILLAINKVYLNPYHWQTMICFLPYLISDSLIVIKRTRRGKKK